MRAAIVLSVAGLSASIATSAAAAAEPYPEGAAIPRSLTPAEAALLAPV